MFASVTVSQPRRLVCARYKVLVKRKGKLLTYKQGVSNQALNEWCRLLQIQLLDENQAQRKYFSPEEIKQLDDYYAAIHIHKMGRSFYIDQILMQGLTLDKYLKTVEKELYPHVTDDWIDDPSTAP